MKKFIFLGPEKVGKSSWIIVLSKVLASMNKRVLVIDITQSQSMFSFFNYNFNIESRDSLDDLRPILRDNFEILFSRPGRDIKFDSLSKLNLNKYDYVFIECDKNVDKEIIYGANKIFIFQDSDKHTLLKNKVILRKLKLSADRVSFVFNSILDLKYDTLYFLSELLPELSKSISVVSNDVEVPFIEGDMSKILESKIDGRLNLSTLSEEFKASIVEFMDLIDQVDLRSLKRVIR